jgi:hypothetical protein
VSASASLIRKPAGIVERAGFGGLGFEVVHEPVLSHALDVTLTFVRVSRDTRAALASLSDNEEFVPSSSRGKAWRPMTATYATWFSIGGRG